jgi:hypothetical protein
MSLATTFVAGRQGPALRTLGCQSLNESRDQLVGDRLIQWKLGSAFAREIGSNLRLEGFVELWYRIDADVLLPAAQVDNWPAAEAEGRDSVADRLLQARSSYMDGLPCRLEDGLYLR